MHCWEILDVAIDEVQLTCTLSGRLCERRPQATILTVSLLKISLSESVCATPNWKGTRATQIDDHSVINVKTPNQIT